MAIYTKRGDNGSTKIFDKKTGKLLAISKSSKQINTIGAIDELNSLLGLVGGLIDIQSDLFVINAILAGTNLCFTEAKTKKLEKEIERLERILPVQKNFIYYGGSSEASLLFYSRAVCRRAERQLVSLSKRAGVRLEILRYMNRLSDFLYIKAREKNFEFGVTEETWRR